MANSTKDEDLTTREGAILQELKKTPKTRKKQRSVHATRNPEASPKPADVKRKLNFPDTAEKDELYDAGIASSRILLMF